MLLPQYGEHMRSAKVISRTKDYMGNVIGFSNSNPILDTCVYNVMLPDGFLKHYAENFSAENMYWQVGAEVYQYQLMDDIIDHRTNGHAVHSDYAFVTSRLGRKTQLCTTKGWFLCVRCKYGSYSWVALKDLK